MDFAFDIPNQESKDGLVDAPPYLGLTASVGDERAIITGWDGSAYYLVGESGQRYHTSAIVWSVDELADPQIMDHNARLANFVADRDFTLVEYNDINGAWHLSKECYAEVMEEVEEEDEETTEEDDGEVEEILEAIEEYINSQEAQELSPEERAHLEAFPFILLAAAVEELDLQDFEMELPILPTEHEGDKIALAPLAIPAIAVGGRLMPFAVRGAASPAARAALQGVGAKAGQLFNKIPGSSKAKGLVNKGLQTLGIGQVADSLFGGGGGGQPYMGRPHQYGLYSHRAHMNPNHLEFMLEKTTAQDDRLEALRAQVYAAIDAWAPAAQEGGANNIWWLVQQGAEKAESFSDLQTVLEAIPPEYHNAIVQGTPLDQQASDPLIPAGGAEVESEPGGIGPAAPSLEPGIPGGPPSGPTPGGSLPGAGPGPMGGGRTMPGGPVASVKKTAEELFFEEIQPKVSYDPSMGVVQPGDPASNVPTGQPSEAEQQAKIQQLAQQYIGQGEPVANAYNRAVLDYMQQITPPVAPPASPGVPVAPGQMYSKTAYDAVVEQDGQDRANLKCPECGGQTIQYAGEDYFHCSTCGNEWEYKFRTDKSSKTSAWLDTEGKPLKTGQLYKMTSPEYPLADFVRVTWIEPENIRVAFENNENEADIDTQEYRFERVDLDETPKTASVQTGLEWLFSGNEVPTVAPPITKEARKRFSPQEQKAFIDEPGVARNKDRLDLKGTHFSQSNYDELTEIKPENPDAISDDYIF